LKISSSLADQKEKRGGKSLTRAQGDLCRSSGNQSAARGKKRRFCGLHKKGGNCIPLCTAGGEGVELETSRVLWEVACLILLKKEKRKGGQTPPDNPKEKGGVRRSRQLVNETEDQQPLSTRCRRGKKKMELILLFQSPNVS